MDPWARLNFSFQVSGVLTSSHNIFSLNPVIPNLVSIVSMTCRRACSTKAGQSWLFVPSAEFFIVSCSPLPLGFGRRWPTGMRTTNPSLPSGDAVGSLRESVWSILMWKKTGLHSSWDVYVKTWLFWHWFPSEDIIEGVLVVFRLGIRMSFLTVEKGFTDEEDVMSVQFRYTTIHSPVEWYWRAPNPSVLIPTRRGRHTSEVSPKAS